MAELPEETLLGKAAHWGVAMGDAQQWLAYIKAIHDERVTYVTNSIHVESKTAANTREHLFHRPDGYDFEASCVHGNVPPLEQYAHGLAFSDMMSTFCGFRAANDRRQYTFNFSVGRASVGVD